jgi:hypothetical protein
MLLFQLPTTDAEPAGNVAAALAVLVQLLAAPLDQLDAAGPLSHLIAEVRLSRLCITGVSRAPAQRWLHARATLTAGMLRVARRAACDMAPA